MKEYIEKLVKTLSGLSSSVIRGREFKQLGYGKFEFKDEISKLVTQEETHSYIQMNFELNFIQPGYKTHCIIRKRCRRPAGDNLEEFYAQFYDELVSCATLMKSTDNENFQSYSFAELINKGLRDCNKVE